MRAENKQWISKFLFGVAGVALLTNLAFASTEKPPQKFAQVQLVDDKDAKLLLEVKQMPLAKVLQELSVKTGTPIHYSVLPEGLITATCVSSSLKPVLECLLNRKADIIVRYYRDKAGKINTLDIAEAWVLGAKLEALPNKALCQSDGNKSEFRLNNNTSADEPITATKSDQTDFLLKIAESGKPIERAQAISDLLSIGRQDDPKVRAMLEQSVHDPDANVRSQAVSTLTHRDDYDDNAPEIIREALQDDSVDVRLMAVDGIRGDASLLEQALSDPDETVRSFATSKLDELRKLEAPKN